MSKTYCQTCKDLLKEKVATQWCMFCAEPLCEACVSYHKVLKITKDHVTIKYQDYQIISDCLPYVETKCKNHPEKQIEYYCVCHRDLCCLTCKEIEHAKCNNVIYIMEKAAKGDLYQNLQSFSENQCCQISNLDTIIDYRRANIDKLNFQHEEFLKHLKEKRKKMNLVLDKIESEITEKFEKGYHIEKKKIEEEYKTSDHTRAKFQKEGEMLTKIIQVKPLSYKQLVMATRHFQRQGVIEQTIVEDMNEQLSDVSCKYHIALDITKENRSINVIEEINFVSSKQPLGLEINTEIENCSELENCDLTSSSVTSKHVIPQNLISKQAMSTILPEQSDELISEKVKNDSEQQLLTYDNENRTKEKPFKYDNRFMLQNKFPETNISCIKHLPNGGILFGECWQPRLLLYERSFPTALKREMKMNDVPKSMALVDATRIAVATGMSFILVNFHTLTIEAEFNLGYICNCLTSINNTLVVGCETYGLRILDFNGVNKRTLISLNDVNILTAFEPNTVVYAKRGSELVHFVNTTTNENIQYKCEGLLGATGITADEYKNVYVSCDRSNSIYKLPCGTDTWKPIISSKDGIHQPQCIEYYKDALYIINYKRVVYIYRRL